MDLIKNSFLKRLDSDEITSEQKKNFSTDWTEFLSNLKISSRKVIPSSVFLKQFLLSKYGKNLKKDDLFDFFRKEDLKKFETPNEGFKLSGNEILDFAKDLNSYSKIYADIEKNSVTNKFGTFDQMFILFKVLHIKQFHPLLMLFYFSDEESKEKILSACVRLGVSIMFSFTQTNKIESMLPDFISKYYTMKNQYDEKVALDKLISNMNEKIADQKTALKTSLENRTLKKAKAVSLLKTIELLINDNSLVKTSDGKHNEFQLEHILPQTRNNNSASLEDLEFENDKDYRDHLFLIGNLTFLNRSDNSSADNKDFYDKKKIYMNTEYKITKSIVGSWKSNTKSGKTSDSIATILNYEKTYDTNLWTKSMINDRSKDIARLMVDFTNDDLDIPK